jgi:hypothetical protein
MHRPLGQNRLIHRVHDAGARFSSSTTEPIHKPANTRRPAEIVITVVAREPNVDIVWRLDKEERF